IAPCNKRRTTSMVAAMHNLLRLALLLTPAICIGCGGSRNYGDPLVRDPGRRSSRVEQEEARRKPATDLSQLTTSEIDSLFADTDWLLDSLGVPFDTHGLPGIEGTDLPDLSDSLVAVTEARVPSQEELFDYPIEVNHRVLAWIDYYLGRGKRSFDLNLKRSGRYLAMARRIFAEEGVPQDLTFLAHVESGFRFNARSRAKALGLWQFMRGTARMYELRCDSYVDERLDPERETRAAAQHLRDLHERYGDWYLALAAYNAGAGKVDKAIKRSGTRNFWEIARTRHLVNETRNFVPAILASTLLAKSPGAYGLTEEADPPLEYENVSVDSPTDLRVVAQCTGASLSVLQELNPALLLNQTPPGTGDYDIHVPTGTSERFEVAFAMIPRHERLVFHRHTVSSGETLGLLARRYGTNVRAIQDANRLGRSTLIRVGQTLKIPSRHDGIGTVNFNREQAIRHTVRRGQCLGGIAKSYGVTVRQLQDANGIANPSRISPGQVLLIPPSKKRGSSAATTDSPTADVSVQTSPALEEAPRAAERLAERSSSVDVHSDGIQHLAWDEDPADCRDSLGRVPTTAHIVAEAREAIEREKANGGASDRTPREPCVHVVRRGDNLSSIASRHSVSVSQLRRWNDLGRSSIIHPGKELLIADPPDSWDGPPSGKSSSRLHIVRRGESLWKIAKRYRVRVSDLLSWNRLRRNATIYPGQKLKIY
ncbi:LysM peptidoglycan-binding domain-containing protein, partial [Candidatus Eisenbacteria bacterium]